MKIPGNEKPMLDIKVIYIKGQDINFYLSKIRNYANVVTKVETPVPRQWG